MVRALYIRTLKAGVSDDDFVASWMPERYTLATYPADVVIARSATNSAQVLSIFDIDVDASGFDELLPRLVHSDAEARLANIVESTEFEGVFRL